jgi:DNA polymerase III subunit gamma/tau
MSYLVLARKWRPSTFDEVVGQQHVRRTLKNAVERDRVAHALLFTGSRGVGKTSCARILAKALNCETGPRVDPCGTCAACVEIGAGTSVDVFEIDGASNNSVDQIREIRESVKFLPTRGKRKMYIIDEVHMLSTSAFNALLKTLEEPPAHVLFVFATTEPHKIPETIISRCQRFDFKRIPETEIVEALARIGASEGLKVESAALRHIAREAKGGMRDSLSLLDQVISFCGTEIVESQVREVLGIADRSVLYALTGAILERDGQRALRTIDELFRFGLDLQKFAAEFLQHLRDLVVVKVVGSPERLVDIPSEELVAMAEQVAQVPAAGLHRLFDTFLKGAEEVGRSPYPKLVLEMTLLRLCHQGPTMPLAEVLAGLGRLEARLNHELPPEPQGPPPSERPRAPSSAPAATPSSAPDAAPEPGPALVNQAPAAPAPMDATPAPAPSAAPVSVPAPTASGAPPPPASGAPLVTPEENVGCVGTAFAPLAGRREPSAPSDAAALAEAEEEPAPAVPAAESAPVQAGALLQVLDFDAVATPIEAYEFLVEQLKRKDAFFAAEVEQSVRLVSISPQVVRLIAPISAVPGLRGGVPILEALVRQVIGPDAVLALDSAPDGDDALAAETLSQRRRRLREERAAGRKQAARRDPAVVAAISALGAQVVNIIPR